MPFNFPLFAKLTFLQFFKSKGTPIAFNARRRVAMLLWYLVIPIHSLLTIISFYLDEIFFSAYRKQAIEAPVFIVGNFRCGSTLLQRLLARDPEHFTSMNVSEIYVAPTITQRKFWKLVGWLDKVLAGGRGRNWLLNRDQRWLNSIQMHKVGLFTPEEDEGLLITMWSTMFLQFVFPIMDELPPFDQFDEKIPAPQRTRIMGFYRAIIRRHLYSVGGKKIYLAKGPAHSGRIESLREAFPDARFIYLARNPLRLVPSALNFFKYIWRYFGVEGDVSRFHKALFKQMKYWYTYPLERFRQLPAEAYRVLRYDDFVANVEVTIDDIYNWLGIPLRDGFRSIIHGVMKANQAYESDNKFSLVELGLTEKMIVDEFDEIFKMFRFEPKVDFASVAN